MTALFQLAAQHRALSDKLHDLDLDDQTIADTLEGESGDLIEKCGAGWKTISRPSIKRC